MARTYQVTAVTRAVNRIARGLTSLGIGPKNNYVLTVTGRSSGLARSTPVSLVIEGGKRWLVAPYGEVAWVQHARAAGRVTLARGKTSEVVPITELGPAESAPVLKTYVTNVSITRPYFDVRPDSPVEAFAAEAPRHPVFLIGPAYGSPTGGGPNE